MNKLQFVYFISELRNNFNTNNDDWENKSLDEYLEAIMRYTEDIQGFYDNMDENIDTDKIDFKVFADILKGASIYE